jgi:hypothetical protein
VQERQGECQRRDRRERDGGDAVAGHESDQRAPSVRAWGFGDRLEALALDGADVGEAEQGRDRA